MMINNEEYNLNLMYVLFHNVLKFYINVLYHVYNQSLLNDDQMKDVLIDAKKKRISLNSKLVYNIYR
jgi:hypothetical protein